MSNFDFLTVKEANISYPRQEWDEEEMHLYQLSFFNSP